MDKKNVLFSDANHGGLVLLEEYSKYTNNNLFFYDVYNKLSKDDKENLSCRFNVKFLTLDEILLDENSYIKVNPVHMPPVIKTDYTHHEFVSYLLNKMNANFKVIQVTGVKGKTTVTSFLREIFSNYNTLVLTSDKVSYNNKTLMEKLSITPASIITAVNLAKEEGVLKNIDYAIFEVSLGVVPGNYINVLTNILEDYPIAKSSNSASRAKESVFKGEITLCDYDCFVKYYDKYDDVITLSLDNDNADIYSFNIDYDLDNTTFCMKYFNTTYKVKHFALSDFYINNLLFAIAVGLLANIDMDTIVSNLDKFSSIDGRNSYKIIEDKIVIEDINPGLNTTSIKKCIDNLSKYNQDYIVIVGGDYGITCEEIDEERLSDYLKKINAEKLIFTGKLGESIAERIGKNHVYIPQLKDAVNFCVNMNDKNLIQIIYRSKYNTEINYQ